MGQEGGGERRSATGRRGAGPGGGRTAACGARCPGDELHPGHEELDAWPQAGSASADVSSGLGRRKLLTAAPTRGARYMALDELDTEKYLDLLVPRHLSGGAGRKSPRVSDIGN
jgi:hypothetical protein